MNPDRSQEKVVLVGFAGCISLGTTAVVLLICAPLSAGHQGLELAKLSQLLWLGGCAAALVLACFTTNSLNRLRLLHRILGFAPSVILGVATLALWPYRVF